jgi:IS30 family transposase
MELRSRGWSIMAAACELEVSRTAGNNWSRGYKTYRNGEVTGFVPALDRLAVREFSARYLSHLLAVENELNNRHRRVLGDRAPAELFCALLTSGSPPVLRR